MEHYDYIHKHMTYAELQASVFVVAAHFVNIERVSLAIVAFAKAFLLYSIFERNQNDCQKVVSAINSSICFKN